MATSNGRGKGKTGRKTRIMQARSRKSPVFKQRALAIAVQLAFAVGVGTFAFPPTDAVTTHGLRWWVGKRQDSPCA